MSESRIKTLTTAGQLASLFASLPPNTRVVFSSDPEGNSYSDLTNGVGELAGGKVLLFYPSSGTENLDIDALFGAEL